MDEKTGERIRRVRTEFAQMDQRAFAAVLGVSSAAVGQWETGTGCTRLNLDRIADSFGISREWLYADKGCPKLDPIVSEMHMLPPKRFAQVADYIRFQSEQHAAEVEAQKQKKPVRKRRRGTSHEI